MKDAGPLVRALREPSSVAGLAEGEWTSLIAVARAESLSGSLAYRLEGQKLPAKVERIL